MKKIILVLMALLLSTFAAAQPLRNLVFEWEQVISEDFGGWYLYMSETAGTGYVRVLDIPYTGQTGPIYTDEFIAEGTVGQVKQFYFVLSAYDQDGNESAFSNEAQARIDFEAPSAPFQLIIKIQRG